MKSFAKILIVVGIFAALFILGRALYYSPNGEVEAGDDVGAGFIPSSQTVEVTDAGLPERLIIPKIGVDATVVHLGVTKNGNMAAPKSFPDVGWYKYGTVPGEKGSAVIAGHEDNAISTPAVFYDLHKLVVGDEVLLDDENGQRLRFRVVKTEIQPYNLTGAKLEQIFTASDKARLNLITCAGDWLPSAKTNDKRLIVYTELVK
jgi:sortase A